MRSFLGGVNYTIKESQFGDEGVTTMIEVSLTDFADFLSRNGVVKVSKVREIKFRKNTIGTMIFGEFSEKKL